MLKRADAVKALNALLEDAYEGKFDERKQGAWHFGVVELRMFLDALYGGPPNTDDEKLNKPHWH